MMANIKDCFIESHEVVYSREMKCSFGYSCLCPTESVLNNAPRGLSYELHPIPSHSAPSGKSMIVTLPKVSTTAMFRLGQINT